MGLFDKLRNELVDIVEWIDDSRHTLGVALSSLPQPDQTGCPADCPARAVIDADVHAAANRLSMA